MIYDLQKATMWKRASAFLFDFIILLVAIVGMAVILSGVVGYDKHYQNTMAGYEKYEQQYGVDFSTTSDEYSAMSKEEQTLLDTAYMALWNDGEFVAAYEMLFNLSFIIITFGILLAYLILEFVVPILLGNGQTLGKKIFGIGVMRTDGVKVVPPLMFIRTILGKFTLETMIPVYIAIMYLFGLIGTLGVVIIGLILLVQLILMVTTKTNSPIHDVLAKTVTVDLASQMIFESEEELIAYKEKVHAEQVARQTY